MIFNQIFTLVKRYVSIKQRKFYMFINVILLSIIIKHVSRFFSNKIDEKLIVLGAYGGQAFIGNTKYLFKFLNEHSKYKIIWVTKSKYLNDKLNREGYSALYKYSLKTIEVLRKAKFIFLTHGFEDVLPIDFSPKTIVILTWHGTPIKKINVDDRRLLMIKKWGFRFRLKLQFHQYIDYLLTPTTGDLEHKNLSSAFKVPLNKILNLGYPRHDILFNKDREFVKSLKRKFDISEDFNRIILYCPTFRDYKTSGFKISNRDLKNLDDMLKETNSLFLLKGHHFGKLADHQGYVNIRNISKEVDIHELYLISDVLITDYSSTMVDFSLLDRPILLFPYDLEEYIEKRGMYYNLEDIAPGPLLFTFDDLLEALRDIDEIEKIYAEKRRIIRDRFNKYVDGNSTKRLLDFLNIKYF